MESKGNGVNLVSRRSFRYILAAITNAELRRTNFFLTIYSIKTWDRYINTEMGI